LVPYTGATGILNMGSNLVRSTAVPIAGQDLCNKTYVDGRDATKVSIAGDTMTGNLFMSGATTKITQSYDALTTDTTVLVNRRTMDAAIASTGGQWTTSGTNIYNNNTGNVGIGTSSPTALTHIYGQGTSPSGSNGLRSTTLRLYGYQPGIYLSGSTTGGNRDWNMWVGADVNDGGGRGALNLYDQTAGAFRMVITTAGNVGIGTIAPAAKLETVGSWPQMVISSTSALDVGMKLTNSLAGGGNFTIATSATGAGIGAGLLYVYDNIANACRMVINSSGYVGIGTTAPISLVTGKASSYTQPLLILDAGMANWSGIGAGNVPRGIGQPLMRLGNTSYTNVAGDYYGIGLGYGPSATDYAASEIGWISTNQAGQEEGDLLFSTRSGTTNVAATERQRIKSTGAVGFNGAPVSRHYIQTNRTYGPEPALWTNNSHVCIGYDSPQTNQSPCLFFHQYNTSTTPSNSISVIGSLAPSISWNTTYIMTGTTYYFWHGSNVAYLGGGGFVNTSDQREKQDIQALNTQNSLRKIIASKPVHYERIYRDGDIPISDEIKRRRYIGFLAQEQLGTNPYCVSEYENDRLKTEEDDGKRFGVCYNDYIIHLVGAVQEQQKQIDTLTKRSVIMEELLAKQELSQRTLNEHARKMEESFNEYKALTEDRLNKLASLVQQLLK
jgi:hypothetical protein